MRRLHAFRSGLGLLLLLASGAAVSCAPDTPQTGSQTNWFKTCDAVSDCGGLDCICGTCTLACDSADECSSDPEGSCIASSETGADLLCGGETSADSLCLLTCEDDADCPSDLSCSVGICVTQDAALPRVEIDPEVSHQSLLGFGAALSFVEDEIAGHPESAALMDLLLRDSGFSIVRLRNRYEEGVADALDSTVQILSGAEASAGRAPLLIINSSSPPAELKADGVRLCDANPETCTLRQTAPGEFDYDGFAAYWLDSISAYSAAGVDLDYVSVQNNPDWLPTGAKVMEACHFLPEEGSQTIVIDGADVSVDYPGYAEALGAVSAAMAALENPPELLGPDSIGAGTVAPFEGALDSQVVSAMAFHFYDVDPADVDTDLLAEIEQLGSDLSLPIIQSEMQAEGLDTAVLIHHAMVDMNAVAYLQNDFAASSGLDPNPFALVQLTADTHEIQGAYYALWHYAYWTAPDWTRVDTSVEGTEVLATAWTSPQQDAATLVLVNPASTDQRLELDLGALPESLTQSEVVRTVFDGSETGESLGELSDEHLVDLPAGSILTVAFSD